MTTGQVNNQRPAAGLADAAATATPLHLSQEQSNKEGGLASPLGGFNTPNIMGMQGLPNPQVNKPFLSMQFPQQQPPLPIKGDTYIHHLRGHPTKLVD